MANPSSYLLHPGLLIDGTGHAPIKNAAIFISDGKIKFVGNADRVPSTEEETIVINAPELTVMPGLIDGNNSCSGALKNIKSLSGYFKYGVTTMMGTSLPHHEPPVQELRDTIENDGLPGCSRLVAGNMITCTNGRYPGINADGPWEIRRAVREMAQGGADFIMTASTGAFGGPGDGEGVHFLCYTQEELNALVDESHSWNMPVAVHVMTQPGLSRAIEANADIILHGCFMDNDAIDKMARKGIWYLPTLIITSPRTIENLKKYPGMYAKKQAAVEVHRAGVRQAIKAGVKLCLGGHGMGFQPHWNYGEATAFELAELVRCGMTPLQAITTGTLETAKAFRVDDRIGSLEQNKEADILCLEANPLEDIEMLQQPKRVAMVFKKGKIEYTSEAFASYVS